MGQAKREVSLQSRSIHIVPKNADVAAEPFHTPPQLLQARFRILTEPLSAEHASSETSERPPMVNPATVLRELFELLEDYAPAWYTEENHDRAVAALSLTRH